MFLHQSLVHCCYLASVKTIGNTELLVDDHRAVYSYYTTGIDVASSAATITHIPSDPYRSRVTFSTKICVSFAVDYCRYVHLFL